MKGGRLETVQPGSQTDVSYKAHVAENFVSRAIVARAPRRVYATPKLRLFGAVRDLTMGNSGTGQDGNRRRPPGQSDIRLKQNIARIGEHPAGFGLYLFDYRPEHRDACGHGRRFGVLADEVARILPHAVSRGEDGFLRVDYARIGVHPAA